jgi:hypothetical protein
VWAHLLTAVLGMWLTASPDIFGQPDPGRSNNHVAGPLVAALALIAAFEVTRPVRWLNVVLGVWLVLAPWVLGYGGWGDLLHSTVVGAAVAVLALVRGRVTDRFGGGWSALWRPEHQSVGGST